MHTEASLSCILFTVKCSKVSLGSFGAFPVSGDLESNFDFNIQGSLYHQLYNLLVFFYLACDLAEGQGPWASCFVFQTVKCLIF